MTIDPTPAPRPQRTTITGRHVSLVPLDAEEHAASLFEASSGERNDGLWTYVSDGPFRERDAFDTMLRAKAASEDPFYFAIRENSSGEAVGYAALMRIDTTHRVIEVGYILFTPRLQRTTGATEAIYLLARYVFDDLGYRRFEWKCDSQNAPSRRAALRFGFTYEGIFRQHMILKGRNRDTAWYSILDGEWPERRARFERWLAPENFDERGVQKSALI